MPSDITEVLCSLQHHFRVSGSCAVAVPGQQWAVR